MPCVVSSSTSGMPSSACTMLPNPGMTRSPCVVAQLSIPMERSRNRRGVMHARAALDRHLRIGMRGAMLRVDGVVARPDAVGLQDARLRAGFGVPSTSPSTSSISSLSIGGPGRNAPGAREVGVHAFSCRAPVPQAAQVFLQVGQHAQHAHEREVGCADSLDCHAGRAALEVELAPPSRSWPA